MPRRQYRAQVNALWTSILKTSATGNLTRLAFWREVFARLAMHNQLGLQEQLASLSARGNAAELIKSLKVELPTHGTSGPPRLDTHLNQMRSKWPATSELLELLRTILRNQSEQTQALLSPDIVVICNVFERSQSNRVVPALQSLMQKLRHLNLTPEAKHLVQALRHWAGHDRNIDTKQLSALARDLEPSTVQTSQALGKEGLPIINAGLVLLWPFLKTFFTRLGLLQDKVFRDRAAQDDAVSLLHYLSTGELEPPEYQLPLNKLLCGLEPGAPWQPQQRLDDQVLAECDGLLDALVVRAPNFGKLSHDGLRGSFLLRRGLLRAEIDGWLLRVERQTFDVLLDRLPWPISWVRLPWMQTPLQVEW
jgi:hypothetical protein